MTDRGVRSAKGHSGKVQSHSEMYPNLGRLLANRPELFVIGLKCNCHFEKCFGGFKNWELWFGALTERGS